MSDGEPQALEPQQLWLLKGLVAEGVRPSGREIAPKAAAFIGHYLVCLNATKAAIDAGYSEHTAAQAGYRLLRNVHIRGELRRRLEERLGAQQVTVEGVLELIRKRAYADIRKLYRQDGSILPVHEWPDDVAVGVAGIETEETWTISGLEVDPVAMRCALRAVGLNIDTIVELVMVRVVKIKVWDPNKSTEMLARYRKMLTPDAAPADAPLMQIPAEAFRRRRLPGDDAVPVPQIVDGRAEHLPADGSHPTPSERRSREGGE